MKIAELVFMLAAGVLVTLAWRAGAAFGLAACGVFGLAWFAWLCRSVLAGLRGPVLVFALAICGAFGVVLLLYAVAMVMIG